MNQYLLFQRLTLSLIFCFFVFCAEYNNPVDPKFKGSYDFEIKNSAQLKAFEIFKPYKIEINNTGSNEFSRFSYSFSENAPVNANEQPSGKIIPLYFKNSYSGTLKIIGIQPNSNQVIKTYDVNVNNPYKICDDTLAAVSDSVFLFIERYDAHELDSSSILQVVWKLNDSTVNLSLGESFVITSDTQMVFKIEAQLIDNYENTVSLLNHVTFRGQAPQFNGIAILDTNNKTINSIPLGTPFFLKINVLDPDSNPCKITFPDTMIKGDSAYQLENVHQFIIPAIKDTNLKAIKITLRDSTELSHDTILNLPIIWSAPEVSLPETFEVPINEQYSLSILNTVHATSFKWLIYKDTKDDTTVIQEASVTSDNFVLNPLSDTTYSYRATVTPIDQFNYQGKTKTGIIIPKVFNYRLYIDNSDKSTKLDTVKFNSRYSLALSTTYKGQAIASGISYQWTLKPTLDTLKQYLRSDAIFNFDSSTITLNFIDSVPKHVSLSVYGVVNGVDTQMTQALNRSIVIRLFKPVLNVEKQDSGFINNAVPFTVTAYDTDSSAVTIYYQVFPDTVWHPYDSVHGITFITPNTNTIYFRAMDTDSLFSDIDTTDIYIVSDRPYISNTSPPVAVANTPISLNAIKANTGTSGKFAIDSIYWDLDNDGSFEVTTAPNSYPIFTGTTPGKDTIHVYCTDSRLDTPSDTLMIEIEIRTDVPALDSVTINPDTQYINKPVTLTIFTTDYNDSTLIASIDTNAALFKKDTIHTGSDSTSLILPKSGNYHVSIHVTDSKGNNSTSKSRNLVIDQGTPRINAINCTDTLKSYYIKDDISFSVIAVDNNEIKKWHFAIDDTSTFTTSLNNTFNTSFSEDGVKKLFVKVQDNEGNYSTWDSLSFSILLGRPTLSITDKPESVYIHDTATFTCSLSDINGRLSQFAFCVNGDTTNITPVPISKNSGDTITRTHTFKATGNKILYFKVWDEDGVASTWQSCVVQVMKGEPEITEIKADTSIDSIYIKDIRKFTIRVSDPNHNADSVSVSWNGSTAFSPVRKPVVGDSCVFQIEFSVADIGNKTIKFTVQDKDGFEGDSSITIHIKSGAPRITQILPDTSTNSIYIKDTRKFTIHVMDPNQNADSVFVSWNGSTAFSPARKRAEGDSCVFQIKFSTADTGNKAMKFTVQDKDGLTHDSTFNITVRLGAPTIGTTSPIETWIKTPTTITISSQDINGSIINRWVDWDKNGVWDDSSSSTNQIAPHNWDTTFGDNTTTFNVKVMDDDFITSTRMCTIFVKMGRPVVGRSNHSNTDSIQWVDGGANIDTMFYVYRGIGTSFAVSAKDSNPNGSIIRYYWDLENDGQSNVITSTPTYSMVVKWKEDMSVWVKDNDSLVSDKFTFHVYPDSVPPQVFAAYNAYIANPDTVVFEWTQSDMKDGDLTQFEIYCGVNNPLTTVVKNFAICEKSNGNFFFKYKPPTTGWYYFRVDAKDARGSVTQGNVGSFNFTK